MDADLTQLTEALLRTTKATLILGAGISIRAGVPPGFGLLMEFGEANPRLVESPPVRAHWLSAKADRHKEKDFANALVAAVSGDMASEELLLKWLMDRAPMAGKPWDNHAVFVLLWLRRVFKHLVTTNWDFMLETPIETLYDKSHANPLQPVEVSLSDGTPARLGVRQLFTKDALDADDVALNPRWDIVANETDLEELQPWSRPVWKIHGSPFFLACPECRGVNRWKRVRDVHVGEPCPDRPGTVLRPEIIFWGKGVDEPYPSV
jgi:hypothetical protein